MANVTYLLSQFSGNADGAPITSAVGFQPRRLNFDTETFAFTNEFTMVGLTNMVVFPDTYGFAQLASPTGYNVTDSPCVQDFVSLVVDNATSVGVPMPMLAPMVSPATSASFLVELPASLSSIYQPPTHTHMRARRVICAVIIWCDAWCDAWFIFCVFLRSIHACSNADWCLQSDGMPGSPLQAQYPGSNASAPNGSVEVTAATRSQPTTVYYSLTGMAASATGGIHIHTGTSCADAANVGGHYWDRDVFPADPWAATNWTSDASGNASGYFAVYTAYGFNQTLGHAVVVHSPTGARIGCGVLASTVNTAVFVTYYSEATEYTSPCGNASDPGGVISLDPSSYGGMWGNRLTSVQARVPPTVTFSGDPAKLYTVMMIDQISAALADTNTFELTVMQAMIVNVRGEFSATGVGSGDGLYEYFSPAVPDAVPGQYVFYVYEQAAGMINVTTASAAINPNPVTARVNFDVRAFRMMYGLGPLIATNFATIFTDTYAIKLLTDRAIPGVPIPSCPADAVALAAANSLEWMFASVPDTAVAVASVVWQTPASAWSACGRVQYFPRTVSSIDPTTPTGMYVSTAETTVPPVIFFQADENKLYTVVIHDVAETVLHYVEVNVPGTLARIGMYGAGDNVVGYFAPGNPSPYPSTYTVSVLEQSGGAVNATAVLAALVAGPTVEQITLPGISGGPLVGVTNAVLGGVGHTFNIGPIVAYNWAEGFTSIYSLALFNEFGLGALDGNVSCPASVVDAVSANASSAGYGVGMPMYPSLGNLSTPLDVTFVAGELNFNYQKQIGSATFEIPMSFPASMSSINTGPALPYRGTPGNPNPNTVPPIAIRNLPIISAPYADDDFSASTYALLVTATPAYVRQLRHHFWTIRSLCVFSQRCAPYTRPTRALHAPFSMLYSAPITVGCNACWMHDWCLYATTNSHVLLGARDFMRWPIAHVCRPTAPPPRPSQSGPSLTSPGGSLQRAGSSTRTAAPRRCCRSTTTAAPARTHRTAATCTPTSTSI